MMEELKKIAEFSMKDREAKKLVERWIDTYDGKILEFRTREKAYTISFSREKTWISEGNYPSPDVIFEGSEEILRKILSKERISFSRSLRSGELMVYGNLHEVFPFLEIVRRVDES
jgi:hypothetical protein